MVGRRSLRGGNRLLANLVDTQDPEEDNQEQQFDQDDEQIMMGRQEGEEQEREQEQCVEQEEENDYYGDEGESHYLINNAGGIGANNYNKLATSGLRSGKQSPSNISGPFAAAADMHPQNLIGRLANYLSRPFSARGGGGGGGGGPTTVPRDSAFDDISTSDFVYRDNSDDISPSKHSANKRLPAYGEYHDLRSAPSQHQQHLNYYSQQRLTAPHHSRSHTRHLLMIMLFLALILSTCLLLLRLLSLIQDEQGRLSADDAVASSVRASTRASLGNSAATRRRQDSVLSELSRKLGASHRKQLEAERASRWLVSSSKCHIPVLDPWHESIKGFVRTKPPMDCAAVIKEQSVKDMGGRNVSGAELRKRVAEQWGNLETLTYVEDNKLFFTDRALEMGALRVARGGHAITGAENNQSAAQVAPCCFRRVSRAAQSDNELETDARCEPVSQQGALVNSSIIELTCAAWNYTNVHAFIVHDQEEEGALKTVAASKLNEDNYYNVIMLGVDTISRLNGQRQLNKTLALLRDLYGTLDFVGYNKVGENTFPNLIPLLTGLKPEQLTKAVQCWSAKNYSDATERGDDYLDNCKYLWNYYQQAGYVTYFSEDWPAASTFNYLKPGFKSEPTTFYGRPFTKARDKLTFPKFGARAIGCASCQLDRPIVEIDLANLRTFVRDASANEAPYFAFQWINCPQHDDLNGASQIDAILEKFLRDLHEITQERRTFVIFFSDHGYRWNDFASTRIGHYESSLPLLTIAPPRHFIEHHASHYRHLRDHQSALITPFDLFKTLIELRDMSSRLEAHNSTTTSSSTSTTSRPPRARRQLAPDGSTLALLDVASAATAATSDQSSAPPEQQQQQQQRQSTPATTDASDELEGAGATAALVAEVKPKDGTTFEQKFTTISLFGAHSSQQLDRSCIDAGIPDNYCVCQQFAPIDANRTDVLGAAYYLVYVHLEAQIHNHTKLCHVLDLERVHHAELYNFEQSSTSKPRTSRHRRAKTSPLVIKDAPVSAAAAVATSGADDAMEQTTLKTTPSPLSDLELDEGGIRAALGNKRNYLPNREYSVAFSTKPGSGLFQEVVRFYGDNMDKCEAEILRARKIVDDDWALFSDKVASVRNMNRVCDFSVHSESLSRFNLYKDQSKCVTSNIELKKICYCNDLINKLG